MPSINIEIAKDLPSCKKIHYIPATTNGNGPVDVEKQFDQYTESNECGTYSNSLRGFPLKGQNFEVPKEYKGVVFHETRQPLNEDSDRTLKAFGSFNELIYWNYDKIPNNGDPLKQALQFVDIAEQLCKPVSMTEIKNEMDFNEKKN